jgi:predicted RNase H-like HicB family nuclease
MQPSLGAKTHPDIDRLSIDPVSALRYRRTMQTVGFTYWQDAEFWLGHLDEFPDYLTQGTSFDDLKEHLLDLHHDLSSGLIPAARRHAKVEVA